MPFFRIHPVKIEQIKKSRQPSPQISRHGSSVPSDDETARCIHKRVSLSVFLPTDRCMMGSMTMEAAVLLPLILFFFLNLCGAIEMLRLHGNLSLALRDTGNQISVYGHAYDLLRDSDHNVDNLNADLVNTLIGIGFSYSYVRQELTAYLGQDYLDHSPLSRGAQRLYFLKSNIMKEQDNIELIVAYEVSPLFGIPGFSSFQMTNRYFGRAWTGYEIPGAGKAQTKDDELMVYVTANGTVWHATKDCTHLTLSVRSVPRKDVSTLTNKDRGRYSLCELCDEEEATDQVFLTDYGDRYHYIRGCSGLKRTVIPIPFSEAYSYAPCSRCSGGTS
jgi:hypothetical protein